MKNVRSETLNAFLSRLRCFRHGVQDISESNQPITVKLGTYLQCNIYEGLTIERFSIFNNFEKYKQIAVIFIIFTKKNENLGSSIENVIYCWSAWLYIVINEVIITSKFNRWNLITNMN